MLKDENSFNSLPNEIEQEINNDEFQSAKEVKQEDINLSNQNLEGYRSSEDSKKKTKKSKFLKFGNFIYKIIVEKSVNKRRKKHELNSEKYICSQCKRVYYSYAALYVHIRRKHNLTLQEIKENFCNKFTIYFFSLINSQYI